jgi:hypothetical protein
MVDIKTLNERIEPKPRHIGHVLARTALFPAI